VSGATTPPGPPPVKPLMRSEWKYQDTNEGLFKNYMTTNTQYTLFKRLLHTFNKSFDGLRHTGRDIQCETI
jgi:hypothetical protein